MVFSTSTLSDRQVKEPTFVWSPTTGEETGVVATWPEKPEKIKDCHLKHLKRRCFPKWLKTLEWSYIWSTFLHFAKNMSQKRFRNLGDLHSSKSAAFRRLDELKLTHLQYGSSRCLAVLEGARMHFGWTQRVPNSDWNKLRSHASCYKMGLRIYL